MKSNKVVYKSFITLVATVMTFTANLPTANSESAIDGAAAIFGHNYKPVVSFYDLYYRDTPTFSNLTDLKSWIHDENIRWIGVYQNPLEILSVSEYLKDYDGKEELFYHAFVIIQTNSFWYSLEKNSRNVAIQRSIRSGDVYSYFKGERREGPINALMTEWGKGTMHSLINYLNRKGIVSRTYNLFTCSCKDFAAEVFNAFNAQNKEYIPTKTWTTELKKAAQRLPYL